MSNPQPIAPNSNPENPTQVIPPTEKSHNSKPEEPNSDDEELSDDEEQVQLYLKPSDVPDNITTNEEEEKKTVEKTQEKQEQIVVKKEIVEKTDEPQNSTNPNPSTTSTPTVAIPTTEDPLKFEQLDGTLKDGESKFIPMFPGAANPKMNSDVLKSELDTFENKPWLARGADLKDFFNYGFNERSWKLYCEKQKLLRDPNLFTLMEQRRNNKKIDLLNSTKKELLESSNIGSIAKTQVYPGGSSGGIVSLVSVSSVNRDVITKNKKVLNSNPSEPPDLLDDVMNEDLLLSINNENSSNLKSKSSSSSQIRPQKVYRDRERDRERDRDRGRDRDRDRDRERRRERERPKDRGGRERRGRGRGRDGNGREWERKGRDRDRRGRGRDDRERRKRDDGDRDRERSRRSGSGDRERLAERFRGKSRTPRKRDRDRDRDDYSRDNKRVRRDY